MARHFPSSPPNDIPSSESKVWLGLAGLPADWHVFHSVRWQSIRGGREGDGEADFLLLHKDIGVIVLEVKGGSITVNDGQWYSTNASGTYKIKNPFTQATTSKYALLEYLKTRRPPLAPVFISHAVAFPDIEVSHSLGTFGPREIILDRSDLTNCNQALKRIVNHWNQKSRLTSSLVRSLTQTFAPTLTIRRTLRDELADVEQQLLTLTNQQVALLRNLRLVRKAAILGGAGTGKTILAREKAIQLAADGASVLLTCFNFPLAQRLEAEFSESRHVRVSTFHSLCIQEMRKAGEVIPTSPSQEWWDTYAARRLVESAGTNGTIFDAVIVDEGQDFAPEWIEALLMTTRSVADCAFYVFSDDHQQIFRRGWPTPAEWPRFHLNINCRNTSQIAARVARVFDDLSPTLGALGPEPAFLVADLRREAIPIITRLISRLIREEHLKATQIAVLTDDASLAERLREMTIDDNVFCTANKAGVVAETIARFKGLEADAVVLALSDDFRPEDGTDQSLLYVGLSRAKMLLFVLGSEATRHRLGW